MATNHLKLNDDKTEILVLTKGQKIDVSVLELPVTPKSSIRSLGVFLDDQLSLDKHVAARCRAAWLHLRDLRRHAHFCDQETLLLLVNRYVFPHVNFCISLISASPQTVVNRLQRVQNSAIRLITGCHYMEHITPYRIQLGILTVRAMAQYRLLCIIAQCLVTGEPACLRELLTIYVPQRSLRSTNQYYLECPHVFYNAFNVNFFTFTAPKLFNVLPFYLRRLGFNNLSSFKSLLKKHLLTNGELYIR